MSDRRIAVVRTGTANLASVLTGLRRADGDPYVTENPLEVRRAARVVLPGVGAFAAAMACLRRSRLVEPLVERIRAGRPTLAVCLGLQLLAESSAEGPNVAGLGVFATRVQRFAGVPRVPQMGWNQVTPDSACRLVRPGHAYFANSYCLADPPAGWAAATADYGGPFVAALERGSVLACQFHPELSGSWGLDLLRRWLSRTDEENATC